MTEWPEALVERCAEKVHQSYCSYYEQVHGKPYWTKGDYSKLSEEVKEFDRASVRAALDASGLREIVEAASAFEDDLSEYCDGPKRDRLRTVLARIKGETNA